MSLFRSPQFRFLSVIALSWLAVFFLTRSVLLLTHLGEAGTSALAMAGMYLTGLAHDIIFLIYAILPLALYALLCPRQFWSKKWHQKWLAVLLAVALFVMLFTAVAEWLFWDEFGARFNFIAVDYLVYSGEVINNILESYPVYPILALLVMVAIAMAAVLHKFVLAKPAATPLTVRQSLFSLGVLFVLAGLSGYLVDQDTLRGSGGNAYQRELAGNGPFQFFAAFRNNELDYRQFYTLLPDSEVASLLRAEVAEPNARFLGYDPMDIRRVINNPGEAKKLNVILVTIESLSAKYLGSFGDERGLTPNLDELRKHSLAFTNFYATGTRTDRGLEAITLSVPPTPGRSIVKRLGRESGYGSLGQQFNAQGYDSVFLYGGRGYFDNMNAFFGGNGYRIVDQSSVAEADMSFKNAWGMSDEDLYQQALKIADADYAAGRPFFLQLMTTSNHRPYTYPDGRIDIPSGEGRAGAVKYTDYAIGQLLAQMKDKPWFKDTLLVLVADHTAGSAGKEDLPVANYHIPLFIYAPGHVEPGEFTEVTSQIDLAPTLLGLLNMDYVSTFFGRNVLREDRAPGRALVGNYQHLGLFDGKDLAILSPRQGMRRHDDALGLSREITSDVNDTLLRRNIVYYQGASHAFRTGGLSWQEGGLPVPMEEQTGMVATETERPVGWAVPLAEQWNLYRMQPGLYRSALPDGDAVPLLNQLGVTTVVNFYQRSDAEWLKEPDVHQVHLPFHVDRVKDSEVIAALRSIREAEQQGPVLIHCRHGQHRTGLIAALYRVVYQGWSKQQALAEMYGAGFGGGRRLGDAEEYLLQVDIERLRAALDSGACSTSRWAWCSIRERLFS